MSTTKALPCLFIALGIVSPAALLAQTTPPATTSTDDSSEVVELSPFQVKTEKESRYQATEATSGTRVRTSLLDSAQSMAVVTRDLIEDIGAGRVLDAAKYVAGVYESTIPNAQDRTTIRGFQNDGATVDGFSYFSFANLDPVIVDRIEVVKGPNAIMAPQGVPGGTVNNVTKKPLFQNTGYASVQVGQYASNRLEVDVNRVVSPKKLAVRVVGAVQRATDYGNDNFHNSTMIMPEFTYQFGPASQLTVQAQIYNWWSLNYSGVPISLYSDSNSKARILDGLPNDFVAQRDDITRHQSAQHYRAFFTTNITNGLSMRVAGNVITSYGSSSQLNIGAASNQVLSVDPVTGLSYWNGNRNDDPQFSFSGSLNTQTRLYTDLQHDFAYEFKTDSLKSNTVAGYWLNTYVTKNEKNRNFVADANASTTFPSQSLLRYQYASYTLAPTLNGWNTRNYRGKQAYVYESLSLFNERLLLSAGLSRNWYYTDNFDFRLRSRTTVDQTPTLTTVESNGVRVSVSPTVTLPSGGVVFKVTKDVSLFYGFSKQATAINPSTTSVNYFDLQTSQQHEFGVRTQTLDKKLYVSLSYFDIKQNNFSIPNPLNSSVPIPNPLLPPVFADRLAHGVELEFNYAINKNLSLVGNGTVMRNRDADGVPFRGTAEKSGALWGTYSFDKASSLGGLTISLGADYLSKRAGDTASGVTSYSTPARVIRVQPSFWLPARTLVNATISYRIDERWKTQIDVNNLLDEYYLQSSTGRQNVWVGAPINAKATVTYRF
ncbi:MAG: TonB-dependent receptor [Nibricoccus sp.]